MASNEALGTKSSSSNAPSKVSIPTLIEMSSQHDIKRVTFPSEIIPISIPIILRTTFV